MKFSRMDEFLVRALLGGFGVAIISGPLGSILIWRRMVFYGATLAHAALLGVALSILFRAPTIIGVIIICIIVALLMAAFGRQNKLSQGTLLGIFAHATLAGGIVVLSFASGVRVDLNALLFGDILAVSWNDLIWIYAGGALGLGVLAMIWRHLLAVVIHEDMARVEGTPAALVQFLFMVLVALVIAIAMKIVGILLIVSLLVIPAATARQFARTPESMAGLASIVGLGAVAGGIWASYLADIPAGPGIVLAATFMFGISLLFTIRQHNH
jgi:zinc transport system permease protein